LQAAASEGQASSEALRLQLLAREASITNLQSELANSHAAASEAEAAAGAANRTAEQLQVTDAISGKQSCSTMPLNTAVSLTRCLTDAACPSSLQADCKATAVQLASKSSEADELGQQLQQLAQVRDALQEEAHNLASRLDAAVVSAQAAATAAQQELAAAQVLYLPPGVTILQCRKW
jgi:hypothetical protein